MSILVSGGMCSAAIMALVLLAFMHLYSIFNLRLFLSILVYNDVFFYLVLTQTPDRNGQWYQHLLTVFTFLLFFVLESYRRRD